MGRAITTIRFWCLTITYIFTVMVALGAQDAWALRHHGTGLDVGVNPRIHGGCEHGARSGGASGADVYECWVERPTEAEGNSYFDPKIKVKYATSFFGAAEIVREVVLGAAECSWIWWYYPAPVRICARFAAPTNPDVEDSDYGNNSNKLKICAYEDPCDGMDCHDGNPLKSPFHHNTPREGAISAAEGAKTGAIVGVAAGAIFGPVGMAVGAALGAAIGALTAVITSHYNHVVWRDIGCVNFPLAPNPPAFANDAFFGDVPHPTVSMAPGATFEEPTLQLRVCQNPLSIPPGQGVVCNPTDTANNQTVATYTVTPRKDSLYDECVANANSLSGSNKIRAIKECKYESCVVPSQVGRQYCATIETHNPDEVCLYHRDGERYHFVKCLDRPGFMPIPQVSAPHDSERGAPVIRVRLGSGAMVQTVDLTEDAGRYTFPARPDADWTADQAVLHQVPVRAVRECIARSDDPSTAPDYDPANPALSVLPRACAQWQSKVCLAGYDSAPMVAINSATESILAVPKNNFYTAGSTIPNTAGPDISLGIDAYAYVADPANPVNNLTSITEVLRPMSPRELDLCVPIPPSDVVYEYAPGARTFTVPDNCKQIDVRLIGGGGSGYAQQGDDGGCLTHFSGGAGANGHWRVEVNPGETLTVYVGSGSNADNRHGGETYLARGGTRIVTAGGGYGQYLSAPSLSIFFGAADSSAENGGRRMIHLPYIVTERGDSRNGEHGKCNWGLGASGPGGGTYVRNCRHGSRSANAGSGGCTYDEHDDEPWEYGGHGRAYINCIWPYE